MLKKTVTTAMLALLLAGTASASPDGDDRNEYYERRGPMPFEAFDRDGDGVVTREEQQRTHEERQAVRAQRGMPTRDVDMNSRFDEIDGDGNGMISRDELQAWQNMRREQRMTGKPNR